MNEIIKERKKNTDRQYEPVYNDKSLKTNIKNKIDDKNGVCVTFLGFSNRNQYSIYT